MAIPIEGFSVVAQKPRIQHLLDNDAFKIPNATALGDEHLWKCSFMAQADAEKFLSQLEILGLNVSRGPDSDAVLVNEFERSIEPYCEWLSTAVWHKAVIGWKTGTRPDSVVAREGWDPNVGSGLTFSDPSRMKHLQFLRLEENLEVFLDKRTGKQVYIARTSTPVDSLFTTAAEIVRRHFVSPGEPSLKGAPAADVAKATKMLQKVVAERPTWWNAQWFLGKGLFALGNFQLAYDAFRLAYEQEKGVEHILRELAGVCLELGKFDEAVEVAERAVALEPDNAELLGNLAVAYLLAGQNAKASKAIDAAVKRNPDDAINQTVLGILDEIASGRRPPPTSLAELANPASAKKKRLRDFFWWPRKKPT